MLRSELKKIIKECLIEILVDGLKTNNLTEHIEKRKILLKNKKEVFKENKNNKINNNQNIDQNNDNVMSSIFSDTANTTLRAQESVFANTTGDVAQKAAANLTPEQISKLVGGDVNRWNKLAF